MQITIEKHVPMPTRTRLPKLPFGSMDVGDSFLAPVARKNASAVRALRQRVQRFQRMHRPWRFSVVQDGECMRVFRVQ